MSKIAILIIVCMLSYSGLLVAFSRAPLNINSNVVGGIINGLGALIPIGLLIFVASQRGNPDGAATSSGLAWAIFGGLCLAVFTLAMTFLFASGENVSFVAPLVYRFAVLASSIVAIVFFSEKAPALVVAGLVLIVVGIGVISLSAYRESRSELSSSQEV